MTRFIPDTSTYYHLTYQWEKYTRPQHYLDMARGGVLGEVAMTPYPGDPHTWWMFSPNPDGSYRLTTRGAGRDIYLRFAGPGKPCEVTSSSGDASAHWQFGEPYDWAMNLYPVSAGPGVLLDGWEPSAQAMVLQEESSAAGALWRFSPIHEIALQIVEPAGPGTPVKLQNSNPRVAVSLPPFQASYLHFTLLDLQPWHEFGIQRIGFKRGGPFARGETPTFYAPHPSQEVAIPGTPFVIAPTGPTEGHCHHLVVRDQGPDRYDPGFDAPWHYCIEFSHDNVIYDDDPEIDNKSKPD